MTVHTRPMAKRGALAQPMSLPKPRQHVIAAIRYEPGVHEDAAPLDCTCGWSGVAGAYAAHRAEVGQRKAPRDLTRVFPTA